MCRTPTSRCTSARQSTCSGRCPTARRPHASRRRPISNTRPEYESPTVQEFADIFEQLARVLTDCCLVNVGRVWRKGVEQLWWTELLNAASHSGWSLVDTLVWAKPNANPIHGNVFSNSHEYVLVLARAGDRLNEDGIRRPHAESTRARFARGWTNHRGVKGFPDTKARTTTRGVPNPLGARPRSYIEFYVGATKGIRHPAPMALALAEHLVKLAVRAGETVLDPFAGSGTTALAARLHGRSCIAIERSAEYASEAAERLSAQRLEVVA